MIAATARAGLLVAAVTTGCAPTVVLPGPPTTAPDFGASTLRTADGVALPVRSWLPDGGTAKSVVIALHGFNDYGNFFAEPAAFLAARGIASYAYDQRGFGGAPHAGLWAGVQALVDDLKTAAHLVRARHPGVPVYLLGASMGGAVIMVAMASDAAPDVDGVILSAPAVWGRETMPIYQRAALWLAAHTVPWLKLTGRGLKIRASDNIEMLRALGADPLVIKETRVDAMHGLTDLMDSALAASAGLRAPALILYGANDEIIRKRPTRAMLRRLPGDAAAEARRIALYDKGFHMLLRDLQRQTVWTDIETWIGDRTASLPSGADKDAGRRLADGD